MAEPQSEPGGDAVVFEFSFADPPHKLWRAVSEPGLVARWLEPDPGSEQHHAWQPLDSEQGRRISYLWRESGAADSVVTFTVSEGAAGGSKLKIVHSAGAVAMRGPTACRIQRRTTHADAANDAARMRLAA